MPINVTDVIAISVAHELQNHGEAEVLAVMLDTAPVSCAGAISVLNHFYGRDDIPIGETDPIQHTLATALLLVP